MAGLPPNRVGVSELSESSVKARILRWRFFIIAAILHVVLFVMVASVVIFQAYGGREDFESTYIAGEGAPAPPPPPPPPPDAAISPGDETVRIPTSVSTSSIDMPSIDRVVDDMPTMPIPTLVARTEVVGFGDTPKFTQPKTSSSGAIESFNNRAGAIKGMQAAWSPGSAGDGGKGTGPTGNHKMISAKFVCYVAQYSGPDWAANLEVQDDKIIRGSIPNLMRMAGIWSQGRLKAEVISVPLRVDSPEIFEKKPPFIFFTGHTDFVLTDNEVSNLRKYLMAGGAIWGDSALAGVGSRFDVAFHREMKRVVPDIDKTFEPLPLDHDLFTKGFFPLSEVPAGMNFVCEPIEVLKIDGDISIIFTRNDYGGMMRMAYADDLKTVVLQEYNTPKEVPFVTPRELWDKRYTFYQNFEPDASNKAFELGVNIITHLLTRFQDKLLLVP